MPIYTVDKPTPDGMLPYPKFHRTFDADGKQLCVLRQVNTDTGEIIRFEYPWKVGPDKRVIEHRETHPAPLMLIAYDPEKESYFASDAALIVEG